jgi:O-antigen ligase
MEAGRPVSPRVRRIWAAWSEDRLARAAAWLAVAAFALLFLEAAATVEVVYTITPSYALFAAACAVGAPLVVEGWLRLPRPLLLLAAALLVLYVLMAAFAPDETVEGVERASETRDLAYVADLTLGLATVGLVAGLLGRYRLAPRLVLATAAGAVLAAVYAVYQWPAQEFGLPFDSVNNALNTSGLTRGDADQGQALFGWERVRGTFPEPQYLGIFLASAMSLVAGACLARGRRRLAVALAALVVLAMALTVSTPPWGLLAVGAVAGALVVAAGLRSPTAAGLAGAGLAAAGIVVALTFANPAVLSDVTGRDASDLDLTTTFRTNSWENATGEWAERPVLGHGPGQSSVQLAGVNPRARELGLSPTIVVLGSAHGLWAAALIDVGLLGAALWVLLLGGALLYSAAALVRRPSLIGYCVFVAGTVAIISSQIVGDRLEMRSWALIALMLGLLAAPQAGHRQEAQEPG